MKLRKKMCQKSIPDTLFSPPVDSFKNNGFSDICPVKQDEHPIKYYDTLREFCNLNDKRHGARE